MEDMSWNQLLELCVKLSRQRDRALETVASMEKKSQEMKNLIEKAIKMAN